MELAPRAADDAADLDLVATLPIVGDQAHHQAVAIQAWLAHKAAGWWRTGSQQDDRRVVLLEHEQHGLVGVGLHERDSRGDLAEIASRAGAVATRLLRLVAVHRDWHGHRPLGTDIRVSDLVLDAMLDDAIERDGSPLLVACRVHAGNVPSLRLLDRAGITQERVASPAWRHRFGLVR